MDQRQRRPVDRQIALEGQEIRAAIVTGEHAAQLAELAPTR